MMPHPSFRPVDRCTVCGGRSLGRAVELPNLPLTGLFHERPEEGARFDQSLLLCLACGHGMAGIQVHPDLLYGHDYAFRTSGSATAVRGTTFFLDSLDQALPGASWSAVLDWGCNDLHLLSRFEGRARLRMGVDPIWRGREAEAPAGMVVRGGRLEELDPEHDLPAVPDLLVCRHTLEHIPDPVAALSSLAAAMKPGSCVAVEVPGFDALVERLRFDHVFHQHVQYFGRASLRRLFGSLGFHPVAEAEHVHDWGSLWTLFRKGEGDALGTVARWGIREVQARYSTFRKHLAVSRESLELLASEGRVFGYGAAQMLPVLAHHLGDDLGSLTAILDDDPAKDGWFIGSLPPPIRASSTFGDLGSDAVLLTALDNAQPILQRLLRERPRSILIPLPIL